MTELVRAVAKVSVVQIEPPAEKLLLATTGLAGSLTRTLLQETLGTGVTVEFLPKSVDVLIDPMRLDGEAKLMWEKTLHRLTARIERESKRRGFYGMYARESYRPNDPSRPTVCLIHGMNSTSSVFLHMVGPIEAAGYGVVVYDFPYNRDLDESTRQFEKDWAEFRSKHGEKQPWAILTHSMGAILARAYVEGFEFQQDVRALVMIAPVNGGSYLAKAQTALQLLQGVQALKGRTRSDPIAHLSEGLGAAADDLTPGSPILKRLAENRPRSGVSYHILAGNEGLISETARQQLLTRLGVVARFSGPSLPGQLDELTDGRGDGCVAVERTRLVGVEDFVLLHANHLELIRAPMIFPDPGPVVSMPFVLDRLAKSFKTKR